MLCIVLTTLPDHASALKLARKLVNARLAACVQLGGGIESIYRWEGGIEETSEVPLLIKTLPWHIEEIKTVIGSIHPYEVPEILILNAEATTAYLEWMQREVGNA